MKQLPFIQPQRSTAAEMHIKGEISAIDRVAPSNTNKPLPKMETPSNRLKSALKRKEEIIAAAKAFYERFNPPTVDYSFWAENEPTAEPPQSEQDFWTAETRALSALCTAYSTTATDAADAEAAFEAAHHALSVEYGIRRKAAHDLHRQ